MRKLDRYLLLGDNATLLFADHLLDVVAGRQNRLPGLEVGLLDADLELEVVAGLVVLVIFVDDANPDEVILPVHVEQRQDEEDASVQFDLLEPVSQIDGRGSEALRNQEVEGDWKLLPLLGLLARVNGAMVKSGVFVDLGERELHVVAQLTGALNLVLRLPPL